MAEVKGSQDMKKDRMLPSDELGEKGESRFKEICADALLICNKADRDRGGWDFIVEFPFDSAEQPTFDSRETPLSCHVQVKTVRKGTDTIKMRLSAAERLAKELKPALVYIFTVNEELEFEESYLLHVLDARLGKILKRLRKERALKATKVNSKTISFEIEPTDALKPTGRSLQQKIASFCPEGMHQYSVAKKMQLENLGFGAAKYHGTMTFEPLHEDEWLDVFLGLKKDVPLSHLEIFQTRFGIPLVDIPATAAKITVDPHPVGQCAVTFRENALADPTVFRADLFVALLPGSQKTGRLRVATPLFSVTVNFGNHGKNKFTIDYDLGGAPPTSAANFQKFWRMLKIFAKGGLAELKIDGNPNIIELPIPPNTGPENVAYCDTAISYFGNVESLTRRAGEVGVLNFKHDQLIACNAQVDLLTNMLNTENYEFSFKGEASGNMGAIEDKQMLFVHAFPFGERLFSYFGIGKFSMRMEGTSVAWRSKDFRLKGMRLLTSPEEFEKYSQSAQQAEKIDDVFQVYSSDCHPKSKFQV